MTAQQVSTEIVEAHVKLRDSFGLPHPSTRHCRRCENSADVHLHGQQVQILNDAAAGTVFQSFPWCMQENRKPS